VSGGGVGRVGAAAVRGAGGARRARLPALLLLLLLLRVLLRVLLLRVLLLLLLFLRRGFRLLRPFLLLPPPLFLLFLLFLLDSSPSGRPDQLRLHALLLVAVLVGNVERAVAVHRRHGPRIPVVAAAVARLHRLPHAQPPNRLPPLPLLLLVVVVFSLRRHRCR
jgi:hypothetical protein